MNIMENTTHRPNCREQRFVRRWNGPTHTGDMKCDRCFCWIDGPGHWTPTGRGGVKLWPHLCDACHAEQDTPNASILRRTTHDTTAIHV